MSWIKKEAAVGSGKAKTLADSAMYAFYVKLVEMAPEITNWELDPLLEQQLHYAAQQAIESLLPKEAPVNPAVPDDWTDVPQIPDESNIFE